MSELKKILIVDDDSKNIYALSAVLKAKRYPSVSAQSAKKGLELLESDPSIALVLLDMMMPDMDGYQTLKVLKGNEKFKSIPVVAVTAQAMTGDKEKCLEAGADAYLSKPVDLDQLVELLKLYF